MTAAPSPLPTRPTVTIEIVKVTPKLATEWLATNHVNRPVRDRKVDQYARDMTAGRWSQTGDTIRFSADGNLLDGQHRLTAIIRAGVTISVIVVRGINSDAQGDMDTGAKRTASDDLSMRGFESAPLLAAGARLAILFTTGRLTSTNDKGGAVSNSEIRDFITSNPEVRESVAMADTWRKSIDAPPSVIVAAHFVLAGIHQAQAQRFFDSLSSRADLPVGSPILALDARLRGVRKVGLKVSQRDYLALFFKAWNHYRKNRTVRHLELGGLVQEPK